MARRGRFDGAEMSQRDLAHAMAALARLSGGKAGVGVAIAEVEQAIGRGHGDMRTPLNLQSLAAEGHVVQYEDGTWALTPAGVAWLAEN